MPLYSFYVEPGVYVKTIREISGTPLPANLRLPIIIGEGAETVPVSDLAMVRASSNTVDNYAKEENVTDRMLDSNDLFISPNAVSRRFKVRNLPIVTGKGTGTVTTDPGHVVVTINGTSAGVLKVEGETGIVHLAQLPIFGDIVKISYFYDKRDVQFKDENLSFQLDGVKTVFKVLNPRIVDGSHGGVTTNDPKKISVLVNGVKQTVLSVDGLTGKFTLGSAPLSTSVMLVTYYSNTFENTADPFPEANITSIRSVGNNPGRVDYVDGTDFVLVDDTIMWGNASKVSVGTSTPGTGNVLFDDSQILSTLIDNSFYFEELTGDVNGTNLSFNLRAEIVDGTGRGRTTDDISMVKVYTGPDVQTALASGPVAVDEMYGVNKQVVLKIAPNTPNKVYASYKYNILTDASYDLACTVAGASGTGKYTIESPNFGFLGTVVEGNDFGGHTVSDSNFILAGGIIFPTNVSDLQTTPGISVDENVFFTFTSPYAYTVTSDNVNGSSGTGVVNKTYVDARTGLRITILDPSTALDVEPTTTVNIIYNFAASDVLRFKVDVGAEFTAGSTEEILQIPGIRMLVLDTISVPVADTGLVRTYSKSGREPSVGSLYYISYEFGKTDFSVFPVSNEREATIVAGTINLENRLALAARVCLRNGALQVGLKQVKRAPNSALATSEAYIEAIIEQETKLRNDRNQDVILPLTGDPDVWGFLKKHVETLSTQFYDQQRRIGIVGFNLGTEPEDAIPVVKSLNSERMWVVYPDGVIITYTDEAGRGIEAAVDGCYLACAVAGLISSPAFDSATPLIGKDLVDFERLTRRLDPLTTKDIITSGVIFLRDVGTAVRIVDAYTSRYGQLLFEEPNVTLIDDELARDGQSALRPFIGQKSLSNLIPEMVRALTGMLKQKVQSQIIETYKDIIVQIDPDDPRVARASLAYKPIFALKWIELTLFVRSTL